jgi:hypothetical protein
MAVKIDSFSEQATKLSALMVTTGGLKNIIDVLSLKKPL